MKIDSTYTLHKVAGENIILLQGEQHNKVISLNSTSIYLWEQLQGKNFTEEEVTALLTKNFDVDASQAAHDAQQWINQLKDLGIIL